MSGEDGCAAVGGAPNRGLGARKDVGPAKDIGCEGIESPEDELILDLVLKIADSNTF